MALKYEIRRMENSERWAVTFRSGAIGHTVFVDGTQDDAQWFARSIGVVPDADAAVFSDYVERRWRLWKVAPQGKA